MTTAEQLWNDLYFCTKRRQEQMMYLTELYERAYKKELNKERFQELWESAYKTLEKFRNRVQELRRLK